MKVKKPQFEEAGFIPTFWDSSGIKESWVRGYALFNRCKFPVVQVHAWASEDTGDLIDWMRQDVPNVRVVFGYGLDGVVNRVASQGVSQASGIRMVRGLVGRGLDQGAVATVLDIEAAAKREPGPERNRVNEFLGAMVWDLASEYHNHPILHTAYDHPTYHGTYPWKVLLGTESPITASLAQVYAAPKGEMMARMGGLDRREAASLASWKTAVEKGWIEQDAPEGAGADLSDVDFFPYYQLHHVMGADTINSAVRWRVCCGWAVTDRMDEEGEMAAMALAGLQRLRYWGEGAVSRFQADHGLKVDDVVGRETLPRILKEAGI